MAMTSVYVVAVEKLIIGVDIVGVVKVTMEKGLI
jgi:hypothetical protein